MSTLSLVSNKVTGAVTSVGGECCFGFRVVRSTGSQEVNAPRTLAELNKWLVNNASKVDAHARASTKKLAGRSSL